MAYAGGFFDADGYVGAYLYRKGGRQQIEFTQRDPAILRWLQEIIGGGSLYARKRGYWALAWASRSEVERVARMLMPFTICKRHQLATVLRFIRARTQGDQRAAVDRLRDLKKISLDIRTSVR